MRTALHTLLVFLVLSTSACSVFQKSTTSSRKESDKESGAFQERFFQASSEKSRGDFRAAYQSFSACAELSPNNPVSYYEMARIDHANNDSDRALEHIKKAIELDGSNYWYHKAHAGFLLDYGLFSEAQKELEWLINDHPDELESYYDLAASYLYQEDGKNAIATYERLEAIVGKSPELSFQKQRIFLLMGKPEKALEEIDALIAAFPEPEFYGQRAEILLDLQRVEEAKESLNTLLELDKTNGTAYLMLSRIYAAEGREQDSWEALQKAFLGSDVSIDDKIGVLLKFYTAADFDAIARERASILLEKLETVHPNDPKTHSMYGDFLLRDGAYRGARDRFEQAVNLDPSRQMIWLQLVELDAQLREWDALTSHAAEARELFPSQPIFYLMLAMGQRQTGQLDKARSNLTMGKSYVFDDPQLLARFWSTLGEVHNDLKEYKKSDDAFDKSLELVPDDPFVLNNYSYYLSLRGTKLVRAASLSLRSNELVPNTPSFMDTYGWILFRQGKHADALEWIGKAIERSNDDPVLFEHYGDVLFHLERVDEAVEAWQEALQLDPDNELLQKKIRERSYSDAP